MWDKKRDGCGWGWTLWAVKWTAVFFPRFFISWKNGKKNEMKTSKPQLQIKKPITHSDYTRNCNRERERECVSVCVCACVCVCVCVCCVNEKVEAEWVNVDRCFQNMISRKASVTMPLQEGAITKLHSTIILLPKNFFKTRLYCYANLNWISNLKGWT